MASSLMRRLLLDCSTETWQIYRIFDKPFWDTSTHLQINLVEHTEGIRSFALSPDNRSLAIGGRYGTIIAGGLSHIIVST